MPDTLTERIEKHLADVDDSYWPYRYRSDVDLLREALTELRALQGERDALRERESKQLARVGSRTMSRFD